MRYSERNGLFIPSYVKYNIERQEKTILKNKEDKIKDYNVRLEEESILYNTIKDFLFMLIIVMVFKIQMCYFGIQNFFELFKQDTILFLIVDIFFTIFLINDIVTIVILLIGKIYR